MVEWLCECDWMRTYLDLVQIVVGGAGWDEHVTSRVELMGLATLVGLGLLCSRQGSGDGNMCTVGATVADMVGSRLRSLRGGGSGGGSGGFTLLQVTLSLVHLHLAEGEALMERCTSL